jgi:acetyl esterase/lipase
MPAVIWIHGGAWQGESQHPNKAAYFATRGYFTASIEYRLAPKNKWPTQIEDCKLAVRWLRANAAKYHVDPDHIGVWGASAGGHLVSCVGTLDDPALDIGEYPGVSSRVQAVCDWCGPVDFRTHGGPGVLFTQSFKENPALHLSGSPFVHIKKDQPPFLVVHGDKDPSVPFAEAVNFVVAMQQAGASVEFLSIHNGTHGMGPATVGTQAELSMSQIFGRMAEFFDQHLKPAPAKN